MTRALAARGPGETVTLAVGWPRSIDCLMSESVLTGATLPGRLLTPTPVDDGGDVSAGFATYRPYAGVDVSRATLDLNRELERPGSATGFATSLELHRLLDAIATVSEIGYIRAVDLRSR